MNKINPLLAAFQQTNYALGGHGKRNIQVLKDVLQDVDGLMDGDTYGNGKLIEDFQEEMAAFLGKESAVFSLVELWLSKLLYESGAIIKESRRSPITHSAIWKSTRKTG